MLGAHVDLDLAGVGASPAQPRLDAEEDLRRLLRLVVPPVRGPLLGEGLEPMFFLTPD